MDSELSDPGDVALRAYIHVHSSHILEVVTVVTDSVRTSRGEYVSTPMCGACITIARTRVVQNKRRGRVGLDATHRRNASVRKGSGTKIGGSKRDRCDLRNRRA
jgi:hypothetical protein